MASFLFFGPPPPIIELETIQANSISLNLNQTLKKQNKTPFYPRLAQKCLRYVLVATPASTVKSSSSWLSLVKVIMVIITLVIIHALHSLPIKPLTAWATLCLSWFSFETSLSFFRHVCAALLVFPINKNYWMNPLNTNEIMVFRKTALNILGRLKLLLS